MENKHRKQTFQKEEPSYGKTKWIKYILNFLFFSGVILTVFEINIFRKTLIDWKIPTGIWFGLGFTLLPFLRKYLAEYYDTKNIVMQLLFSVCSLGGLFTYCFMAANYYLLDTNETEIKKATIIETGHLAKGKNGCGNPYALIQVKGIEKQLVFGCGFEIERYKFVSVKLKRGLMGFDRIIEQVPEYE